MKITVLTSWFNEEIFAPFFLAHYNYVDKIHIFLDADTIDNTEKICGQYDNVEIEEITYPQHRVSIPLFFDMLNKLILKIRSDWVYLVDSDEFIFPRNGESARAILERQPSSVNLLYAQMGQTWRHKTETGLDPSKPSVYQRRHGKMLVGTKVAQWYRKPIIVKPESGIQWKGGSHKYYRKNRGVVPSGETFMGSHWKNADINRTIPKRIEALERIGWKENIDREKEGRNMIRVAKAHLNDPRLF